MKNYEVEKGLFIKLLQENQKHVSELLSKTADEYFKDVKKNQLVSDENMKKISGE